MYFGCVFIEKRKKGLYRCYYFEIFGFDFKEVEVGCVLFFG